MSVSLPPDLERLIREKVQTGLYPSAGEVVREALHLLDERDRLRESRFEDVREQIQVGIRQADRGEVAPLSAQEALAKIRERRKSLGGEP